MKSLLVAALFTTMATTAFAKSDAEEYADRLRVSKVTITEAIAIAQNNVGGTAVEADLDKKGGDVVYEVTVLAGDKLFEVRVNTQTGDVTKVKEE